MSTLIEQSFKFNLWILKLFYLYPDQNYSFFFKLKACLLHLLLVVPTPVLAILHLLLNNNWDINRVKYNAPFLAQAIGFVFKFMPFVYNSNQLKQCILLCNGSFLSEVEQHQTIILNKCIQSCKTNTRLFCTFCVGALCTWTTKPIVWKGRNFPVDIWLPFDAKQKLLVFWSVYVFMIIGKLIIIS